MTATPRRAGACVSAWLAVIASASPSCAAPVDDTDDPAIVPPTSGQSDIEAWFAAGYYLHGWTCEAAVHAAIKPSPHGEVRICANPIAEPDPPGLHLVDSSYVLEIHEGSGIAGFGVVRKTNADAAANGLPINWYWYMRVPQDSATTHDVNGLAADGWGQSGPALDYCSVCHLNAGSGGNPGHDYIWVTP
jgi:hypothetical protein